MKYLTLVLLLSIFASLKAVANAPYEGTEEMTDYDAEMAEEFPVEEGNVPSQYFADDNGEAEYSEDFSEANDGAIQGARPFHTSEVTDRLQNEMGYLNEEAQSEPAPIVSKNMATINTTPKVPDLEEKINFRAAAVKREDNLGPDEVDASDLDGDIFR